MKRNPQVSFLATGTIIRFTLAIILAIVCGMTYVMFLKNAQRADNYTEITKIMALFLSGACSYIPFTVAEVLVIIVLTVFAVYIVVVVFKIITNGAFFSRLFRLLSNVAIFVSFVALLFMAMFGANYFCTPLSSKLELNVRPASVEELKEVTASMLEKANEYSKYVPRDEEGYTSMGNFSSMAERVAGGYRKLGEEYSFLSGSYAPAKPLKYWKIMSKFGIAGIYFPFTGEAIVNPDTPAPGIMFHMAHEMAHRLGVASEDEANFVAYLACRENQDRRANYAGYFMAYRYCINALYAEDRDAADEISIGVEDLLRRDLIQLNENIKKYEGKMTEKGEKINDTYLKVMSQEEGTKSYGMMVDLLIADYYSNIYDE